MKIDDIINKKDDYKITNVIIIIAFIVALIIFVLLAIKSGIKYIFKNNDAVDEIVYVYEDKENYSIYSENEKYNLINVGNYSYFYNIDSILKALLKSIYSNESSKVYDIFSDNLKSRLGEKNVVIEKINNFYLENFTEEYIFSKKLQLKKLYMIPDTNIFFCYLKNKNDEEIEIVLNVDFDNSTYYIENINI